MEGFPSFDCVQSAQKFTDLGLNVKVVRARFDVELGATLTQGMLLLLLLPLLLLLSVTVTVPCYVPCLLFLELQEEIYSSPYAALAWSERGKHTDSLLTGSLKLQEEIYSSSYAAAAYLEAIEFPKDKKVYVVGEVGIQVRGFLSPSCIQSGSHWTRRCTWLERSASR